MATTDGNAILDLSCPEQNEAWRGTAGRGRAWQGEARHGKGANGATDDDPSDFDPRALNELSTSRDDRLSGCSSNGERSAGFVLFGCLAIALVVFAVKLFG